MSNHCFFVLIWLTTVKCIASLECYSCNNIEDLDNCHNTSQCQNDQSCYTNSQIVGQKQLFTLGCTDNQQCRTISSGTPGIVGRGISERDTPPCHECCSTEHCNNLLCSHLKPTTCIDDTRVDCAFLNSMFNICQDIHHSKTVCPKFCKLCNLEDGNWTEWSQWSMCDVTCGNGTQTRIRTCTSPAPINNRLDCEGNDKDVKVCREIYCPVQGAWTQWSDFGACSVTCDLGTSTRYRMCTKPHPARYECFGQASNNIFCMPIPCAGATGMVAFKAQLLKNLSPYINEILVFTETLFNKGDGYDNTTGQFIAPVDGTYMFSVQICGPRGSYCDIDIEIASVSEERTIVFDEGSTIYACGTADDYASLSKGQSVVVRCNRGCGSIFQDSEHRNTFSGTKIK